MTSLAQLTLAPPSLVSVLEVDSRDADRLLVEFGHYLGPCGRPFGVQSWAMLLAGRPVAVAVSASTVSSTCGGDDRNVLVELARLAAAPGDRWATRVMLRLWREACAPEWPHWPSSTYVAYSQNDRHEGRIYRFDGWERVTDRAGSSGGGGTWSTARTKGHPASGAKTLWRWRVPPS